MEKGDMIDWNAREGALLINPRLPFEQQEAANRFLGRRSPWPEQLWVSTSGSSGDATKWVALTKEAFLVSAAAVNRHLESHSDDVWLHALPNFHVGGLAIWARSYLSGARVFYVDGRWNPHRFVHQAWSHAVTLSALVPTQLHDVVSHGHQAPPTMRATLIGGGRLDEPLYSRASELGWKPLPTYGMTECASQVATAPLGGRGHTLEPLMHMTLRLDHEGHLVIASAALLTTYAFVSAESVRYVDPKEKDGTFRTEDRCCLDEKGVTLLGRDSEFIKIAGESASLLQLNALLVLIKEEMRLQGEQHLIIVEDCRLGHAIHLAAVATPEQELNQLIARYNNRVLPPLRIRESYHLHALPRNAMGKVVTRELRELCARESSSRCHH